MRIQLHSQQNEIINHQNIKYQIRGNRINRKRNKLRRLQKPEFDNQITTITPSSTSPNPKYNVRAPGSSALQQQRVSSIWLQKTETATEGETAIQTGRFYSHPLPFADTGWYPDWIAYLGRRNHYEHSRLLPRNVDFITGPSLAT